MRSRITQIPRLAVTKVTPDCRGMMTASVCQIFQKRCNRERGPPMQAATTVTLCCMQFLKLGFLLGPLFSNRLSLGGPSTVLRTHHYMSRRLFLSAESVFDGFHEIHVSVRSTII